MQTKHYVFASVFNYRAKDISFKLHSWNVFQARSIQEVYIDPVKAIEFDSILE